MTVFDWFTDMSWSWKHGTKKNSVNSTWILEIYHNVNLLMSDYDLILIKVISKSLSKSDENGDNVEEGKWSELAAF